ncbi:MAG: hypothetical protein KBG19_00515 [Bacteroidales bacterium]|nr:hypothetical protein [Bacteroidales bacterium]
MAKKLSEDHIKWILSLDASNAEREMNKLKSRSRELESRNKDLRQSLLKLEQQGKRGGEQWNKLSKELSQNKNELSRNREAVKKLGNQMGLTNLTMNQLKQQARDLKRQMDNTSKALHPEAYAKLEEKLGQTRARMDELISSGEKLKSGFSFFKGAVMVAVGKFLADLTQKMIARAKEFVAAGVEMAAAADGVHHAFSRLDDGRLLKNLREATKGTVNDLQLMKAAVQANDFRIPMQDLGKFLEFAQLKAQQTGESVDYMTDSIVKGLGRKSIMILDNLGLSAAEINEEVAKTGDFMAGVSKIVDKQLAAAGGKYISISDKMAARTARIENLQLKVGQRLVGFTETLKELGLNVVDKFIPNMDNLNDKYKEQFSNVVKLDNEIPFLLEKYNSIISSQDNSAASQEELKKTMNNIADLIPSAVTKWDEYGNAIDINTDKIYDFIEAEKLRLEVLNKKSIKQAEREIEKHEKKIADLQEKLNKGMKYKITPTGMGGATAEYVDYTDEELENLRRMLQEEQVLLAEAQKKLNDHNGTTLQQRIDFQKGAIKARQDFNAMNKAQLQAWLNDESNAADQYLNIAQQVYHYRFGKPTEEGPPDETEIKKAYEAELKVLDDKNKAELALLQNQYLEKKLSLEEFEKESLRIQEQGLKERVELAKKYDYHFADIEVQINNLRIASRKDADKKTLEAVSTGYKAQIDTLKDAQESELRTLERQHKNKELSDVKYENKKLEIASSYAHARLAVEQEIYEMLLIMQEQGVEGSAQAVQDAIKRVSEASRAAGFALADQADGTKSYFSELSDVLSTISFPEQMKGLASGFSSLFAHLEDLRKKDSASWNDYASGILTGLSGALSSVQSFSATVFEKETASLEAEKQKQLSIAGDSAEQREAIELKYAQKELDLRKKRANADAVIQIAQAFSSAALAIIQCFSQLGPIAGAVAATLVAATTGLNIATIIKQRNVILNTSLDTSSSPSPSVTRRLPGHEKGGFISVRREQDGKEFNAFFDPDLRGYVDRPTVIVGEGNKSREFIASNDAVENPTVAPVLSIINREQQAGRIRSLNLKKSLQLAGYQSGGFITPPEQDVSAGIKDEHLGTIFTKLVAAINRLYSEKIKAEVSLRDFDRARELSDKFKNLVGK